jgi:hypothetical protein
VGGGNAGHETRGSKPRGCGGSMVSMIRRWIIRCFLIFLCVLCVGIWVGSYWRTINGAIQTGGRVWCSGVSRGSVWVFRTDATGAGWPSGWGFFVAPINSYEDEWVNSNYRIARYHMAGFAIDPYLGGVSRGLGWWIRIPLWFPTTICALFLGFAWRKTRATTARGAFPVEAVGK